MNSIRSAWMGESASERRSLQSGREARQSQNAGQPGGPRSLRGWLETEWWAVPSTVIRETRRGQAEFMAAALEEPPGGSQSVCSSEEAGNDRGAKGRRKVDG